MNLSESLKALESYQLKAMTDRVLDLHTIAEHGPDDRDDNVYTMRDVITLIRVIKSDVEAMASYLIDDGDEVDDGDGLYMSNIHVAHASFDTSVPYVKFGLYVDDDDPEKGVEAIVRKHWMAPNRI